MNRKTLENLSSIIHDEINKGKEDYGFALVVFPISHNERMELASDVRVEDVQDVFEQILKGMKDQSDFKDELNE